MKRRFPVWLLFVIVFVAVVLISPVIKRVTRSMPCANNNPGVCYSIGR
jgi:hypothetical protein